MAPTRDPRSLKSTVRQLRETLFSRGYHLATQSPTAARPVFDRIIGTARDAQDYEDMSLAGRLFTQVLINQGQAVAGQAYAEKVKEAAELSGNRVWHGSHLYLLGMAHEHLGDYEQARMSYAQARSTWQAEQFAAGEIPALIGLANVLFLQGSHAEALDAYQEVLRLAEETDHAEARSNATLNIGLCMYELGRWDEAVASFYRSLSWDETFSNTVAVKSTYNCHVMLGDAFLLRNMTDKARATLRRTTDAPPGEVSARILIEGLLVLAKVYARQGETAAALATVDRGLSLARSSSEPAPALLGLRAELTLAQGNVPEALKLARESVSVAQACGRRLETGVAIAVLATAQAAAGLDTDADESFQQSIELLTGNEESHYMARARLDHGRFLLERGRAAEGLRMVRAAQRTFRRLRMPVEAVQVNDLLLRYDTETDQDSALLRAITDLASLGLDPVDLLEQTARMLCGILDFDSASVATPELVLLVFGQPATDGLTRRAADGVVDRSPTVLSWPVRTGSSVIGRIHLERGTPRPEARSPLVLDTVTGLLADAVRLAVHTAKQIAAQHPQLAGLRFRGAVGPNQEMMRLLTMVRAEADSSAPVLILGESGTGRDLVARTLHESGRRAVRRILTLDCRAVPASCLAAELFGTDQHPGRLSAAAGGTLLLDEADALPVDVQSRLLESLDGEPAVRLVAMTGRDIDALASRGEFLPGLRDQFSTRLVIPALRDRLDDLPALVRHFISDSSQEFGRDVRGIEPDALLLLAAYRWPGNVRELEQVVERAVLCAGSQKITVADLPPGIAGARP